MVQGKGITKVQLKKDLDQLGHNIFSIDLQIQTIRQGPQ